MIESIKTNPNWSLTGNSREISSSGPSRSFNFEYRQCFHPFDSSFHVQYNHSTTTKLKLNLNYITINPIVIQLIQSKMVLCNLLFTQQYWASQTINYSFKYQAKGTIDNFQKLTKFTMSFWEEFVYRINKLSPKNFYFIIKIIWLWNNVQIYLKSL